MAFENHVFVSYAHSDNIKAPDDEMGWVTSFTEYLKVFLTLSLGPKAQIWRDDKLQGNDEFGPEIEEQFAKTAVLVAVISEPFLESEWCRKEVDEFCAAAQKHGGLIVDNKARVFRVLPRSLEYDRLQIFKDLQDSTLVYPFYTEIPIDNQGKGGRREVRLDTRTGHGQAFRQKVELLSDEIVTLIEALQVTAQSVSPDQAVEKSTVYLAECSYDLRPERDRLAADLSKHGYKVLPDQRLPELESEYVEEVNQLLGRCQLSIHLVGSAYGSVPDGPSGKSVTALQNEVAAARSKASGLNRLIWLPEPDSTQDDDQKQFVERLKSDADLQWGADLIASDPQGGWVADIETLKSSMHEALQSLEQSQVSENPEHEKAVIYVICDARDRKSTIPLRKYLKEQGYEVYIPVFEADSAEQLRLANEKQLQDCDAVILWYGEGDEAWHATLESDLRRARGLRDGRPFKSCYSYLAGSLTDDKEEMLATGEANLINGLGEIEFTSQLLSDFEKELGR